MQATNLAERAADLPSLDSFGPDTTVGELTSMVISVGLTEFLAYEPDLRTTAGEKEVHKARVEIQRMRARLRALRPVLHKGWVTEIDGGLKWLAGLLGTAREFDVHARELSRQLEALPTTDVWAGEELRAALTRERGAATEALKEGLDAPRFNDLVNALLTAAADPPVRNPEGAQRRARAVLPGLIAKRWKRLARAVDAMHAPDPPDDAVHRVRKAAKKLRYASEMAGSVIGPASKGLTKAAASLQDVLGEAHDAATTEVWLRGQVLVLAGSDAGIAAGELLIAERARARRCRARWPKRWRKARRKKLRNWLP